MNEIIRRHGLGIAALFGIAAYTQNITNVFAFCAGYFLTAWVISLMTE